MVLGEADSDLEFGPELVAQLPGSALLWWKVPALTHCLSSLTKEQCGDLLQPVAAAAGTEGSESVWALFEIAHGSGSAALADPVAVDAAATVVVLAAAAAVAAAASSASAGRAAAAHTGT